MTAKGKTCRGRGVMLALDLDDPAEALLLAREIGTLAAYKVGLQLFSRSGPSVVRGLRDAGVEVFLDLKFHDIPNTVAKAVAAAADLGVSWLTVHASGGERMVAAAREAAGPAKVLAVTVLTSLSAADLAQTGVSGNPEDQVLRLGRMARGAGAHGLVSSPREARALRKALDPETILVTPGIRAPGSSPDDQSRTATPGQAAAWGADFIVVGRPVLKSLDRKAALRDILKEMDA